MKTYCFDLDGTICTKTENSAYHQATPIDMMVREVNRIYDQGHYVKIYTARGGITNIDWSVFTKEQLEEWGVKHHELIMGKPAADYYIDDKAMTPKNFLFYSRD